METEDKKEAPFTVLSKEDVKKEAKNLSMFILGLCTGMIQKTVPSFRYLAKEELHKKIKKLLEVI